MDLLERDDAAQRWRSSEFTDEVSLARGAARLVPSKDGAVLVGTPEVRALVGGRRALGIALVGEAEFSVGGARFRVRAGAPVARRFEAGARATVCARCKLGIEAGDAIVECACGALLHEGLRASGGEALLCLSYTNQCVCGRARSGAAEDEEDD